VYREGGRVLEEQEAGTFDFSWHVCVQWKSAGARELRGAGDYEIARFLQSGTAAEHDSRSALLYAHRPVERSAMAMPVICDSPGSALIFVD